MAGGRAQRGTRRVTRRRPESRDGPDAPARPYAGFDYYGGYCFLNNAAMAAQALLDAGAKRVAVLDIDYHHGNGTQSIFYEHSDVFTISIHGDPSTEYPFFLGYADETGNAEGQGWNLNLPLKAGTAFDAWNAAVEKALERIAASGVDAMVVALRVDTFEGDPISAFKLRSEDYVQVGRTLACARLPTVFTMEGGYAVSDVGGNVANALVGFGR